MYVPPVLDPLLRWSDAIPFDMEDATDIREWPKTFISHKPLLALPPKVDLPVPQADRSGNAKRIFTLMKAAEKRKGRNSDTFNAKQNTADKCTAASGSLAVTASDIAAHTVLRPAGCKWSSNSCLYNSTLFVLYNLWRVDPAAWTIAFKSFRNPWLDMLAESFDKHVDNLYTLEEVRDYVR